MRGFFANYQVYKNWIWHAGIKPTQSAIGVKELVFPGLTIEIEVLAAA